MSHLQELTDIISVSGYEKNISNYIYNEAVKIIGIKNCKQDKIGNVICKWTSGNKNKKKVIINSHIDEVGFQIYKCNKDKFLFKPLGNIKTWNAFNQFIEFENGAIGIIRANDASKLENFNYDNLYIEVLNGKVTIGDVCTFQNKYFENDDFIISKSIDNRISCNIVLELMSKIVLNNFMFNHDLYFTFSVQEETTMRGIRVLSSTLTPDLILNLDTSPENARSSIKLGDGLAFKISDSIAFTDREYTNDMIQCAQQNNMQYQLEVSDCGTNELIISNQEDYGSVNIGISIPCIEMHTSKTQTAKKDINDIGDLIISYMSEL